MNITGAQIILWIMAAFSLLGTVDRFLPKRFGGGRGYGEAFENGIKTTGPLILSMAAIYAVAPSLASVFKPIITPIFKLFGADPGVFAGMLLAVDMGGFPLAAEMAETEAIGNFGGLIIGSMMGVTIVFTIPVFLPMISKEDSTIFSLGILCGILTIPFGAVVGGLVMGLPLWTIIKNLLPLALLCLIIALGLLFFKKGTIRVFCIFGNLVTLLLTMLLGIAVFQSITGFVLPFFGDMQLLADTSVTRFDEGLLVCARIGVMLSGAFPMVKFLEKHLTVVLKRMGEKFGISSSAVLGMVASLANSIAMMRLYPEMDDKGKLYNIAFSVSASFVIGDHLAFTASVAPDMVVPMLIGKLVSGMCALVIAAIFARRFLPIGEDTVKHDNR